MKIRDRVKELRRVKASELIPHPRNWRRHPQAQADALRGVLAEIGYADALLVRETPDGLMLIDGHLRAETTPDMEVPVLVLDVTEDEADKMLVTLDPLAAMATAAEDVLAALLESVVTESDALRAMLDDLAKGAGIGPKAGLTDPDDVPEVPEEPVSKTGDLWLCGDHRVMCGDSTKAEAVVRLMAGEKAAMMVTDPPYGVAYSSPGKRNAEGHLSYSDVGRRNQPIANDDLGESTPEFWREALGGGVNGRWTAMPTCSRHLAPCCHYCGRPSRRPISACIRRWSG